MSSKTKDQIKAFFQTGDKPTESQFIDLIDSYVDRSGPLGTLEAACSGGNQGVMVTDSGGTPQISPYGTVRDAMGITVYTTANTQSAMSGLFATTANVASLVPTLAFTSANYSSTAQANAGTDNTTVMSPVLVKNAIASLAPASSSQMVLLGTQTAATSSTLSFTSLISSAYSKYMVVFEDLLTSATSSIGLKIAHDNSTFTDNLVYQKKTIITGTSTAPTYTGASATTPALLTTSQTTSTWSGWAEFTTHGTSGNFMWESTLFDPTAVVFYNTCANAVAGCNAIQFAPSAGNFTSGKIYLYGIKNS